jgi:hypothetical protein
MHLTRDLDKMVRANEHFEFSWYGQPVVCVFNCRYTSDVKEILNEGQNKGHSCNTFSYSFSFV